MISLVFNGNNERINFNNNQNARSAHGMDWARAPPISQMLNSSF